MSWLELQNHVNKDTHLRVGARAQSVTPPPLAGEVTHTVFSVESAFY